MNAYTGIFQPSETNGGGLSQDIVSILNAYGRALPVAFIAYILKRSISELGPDLEPLQQRGVIKMEGDNVRLN